MASSRSSAWMTSIALIGLVGTLLSGVVAGPAPRQGSGAGLARDLQWARPHGQDRRSSEEGGRAHPLHDDCREGPAHPREAVRSEIRHQGHGVARGDRQGAAAHGRGSRREEIRRRRDPLRLAGDGGALAREDPAGRDAHRSTRTCSRVRCPRTASGRRRCSRCGCRPTTPSS